MPQATETIESALVSYLSGRSFPDSLKNDAGDYRIFAGESDDVKDGQTLIAWVDGDLTEEPQYSGNYWADCEVELRTPIIAAATGDSETDSLPLHKAAAEVMRLAIMDSAFPELLGNNSFVVYAVLDRNPTRNQAPNYHASGYRFRLYCHPPQ